MSIKFEVKMTDKYMYDYMLYHNYSHFSGLLGAIVGVLGLGIAINSIVVGDTQGAVPGMLVAILFLLVTPSTMRTKAKMQVQNTPAFRESLEYEITEEGIVVRQGEAEALNKWEDFMKAVSTQKSVIVYITRVRALILPKECMGNRYEEIVKMIHTHMLPSKVKIRHIH